MISLQACSLAPSLKLVNTNALPSICRWFGIPSYHVQQMFRQAQGTHYLATQVVTNPSTQVGSAVQPL